MTDFWNWWWHSSNHRFKTSRIYFFFPKISQQRSFGNNNSSFSFEGSEICIYQRQPQEEGCIITKQQKLKFLFAFFVVIVQLVPLIFGPPCALDFHPNLYSIAHIFSFSRKYDVINIYACRSPYTYDGTQLPILYTDRCAHFIR